MTEEARKLADEAYRLFPDDTEPMDGHPLGKIVVDRGNLRFAFIMGANYTLRSQPGTLAREEGVASHMMRSHYEAVTAAKAKITGDGSAFIVNGKRFDHYDEAVKVACADIGLPPKSDDGLLATYHGATREKVARKLDEIAKAKSGVYLSTVCTFAMADAVLALTPSHEAGSRPSERSLSELPVGDVIDHEAAYDLFEALRDATAQTWHEIAARHLAYHRHRTAPEAGTQTSRTIAVMQKLQESEDRDVDFLFTQLADCNSDSARREAVKSLRRQIIVVAAEMAQE